MKRLIVFVAALLLSITALAQDAHLKFKGIPVDGNYKVFADKLVQKGFKQTQATDDAIVLTGTFMAIPNVIVCVYPDPTSKNVSRVAAMVEVENRLSIEKVYDNIASFYKEKYGEPQVQTSEFSYDYYNPYDWRDNRDISQWEVEGGRIIISKYMTALSCFVVCTYIDEQNEKALHRTIINDI